MLGRAMFSRSLGESSKVASRSGSLRMNVRSISVSGSNRDINRKSSVSSSTILARPTTHSKATNNSSSAIAFASFGRIPPSNSVPVKLPAAFIIRNSNTTNTRSFSTIPLLRNQQTLSSSAIRSAISEKSEEIQKDQRSKATQTPETTEDLRDDLLSDRREDSSKPANKESPTESIASSSPATSALSPTSTSTSVSLLNRLFPPANRNGETTTGVQGESGSSVAKLMELAKPEKKQLSLAIGLLFVSSSVSMLVPLTIGKLIDFFSTSATDTFFGLSFPVAATLLATTFCIGAAANAGRAILMRLSGQRIIARVRNQAYLSTLSQEPEFADRGAGDIVSRLGIDTGIVGDSVTSNLSDGLRAIISGVVGVAAMVIISFKLTMVMLAVVPPVSIGAVIYGRYLRKLSNQTQEALGEMSKTAEEKLNAFKTVTVFNAQPLEGILFQKKVDSVFQLARKEAIASGVFYGGSGLTGNLTMLCLLGYGGHLVSRGEITVGDLTSLLIYTGYVGGSVSGLTGFWTGLMKGVGAGSRVFELLDRKSAIPLGVGRTLEPNRNGVIRLEHVSFTYPSRKEVEVLNDVSLEIPVGTSVAIVGPSGSGKSSIQALLCRFYDPNEGVVLFDGEDIRDFTPESWRSRIGVVSQDPTLFSGSVHENIAYGMPEATREQVEQAARMANCDFIWSLPRKFDTQIGKASLSGGQKQRIAIARALVRKPSILLLDEATSALDSASEHAVNSAIDAIIHEQQITVILIAHRLSTIARAEDLLVLEGGRITERGKYRDLSRQPGSRFTELMAAQLALEKKKHD